MTNARRRWFGFGAGVALLGLVAAGGPAALAQEATPVGDEAMATGSNHPAHIHVGNCETLDPNPLVPLANVVFMGTESMDTDSPASPDASMASPDASMASPDAMMATPVSGMASGSAMAIEGGHSTTSVPLPLADILAAEHAINIHLSPEQAEIYVACGAIGGMPDENGDLFIGLREQNDSGVSGIAWLHDNGDGASTTVTLVLASQLSMESVDGAIDAGDATPVASPTA